ncbi:mucin-15 [Centroberyx affinis]|uniref:mucin-15 n=1 Tax=Centroberyx affinis TaxID=166261 RepID=UPI003A5C3386
MELYLKITAGFLLLVQAFHMALLLESTDSPGRTIDKSWLREPVRNRVGSQNTAVEDEDIDGAGMVSSDDNVARIPYGSMSIASGEDGDMADQHKDANETSNDVTIVTATMIPIFPNNTTKQPELPETAVSGNSTAPTTAPSRAGQVNVTGAKEENKDSTTALQNSSLAHPVTQNSTSFPDLTNNTDLHETTLAPESNDTQESTPETDTWPTNNAENTTNVTATEVPEINEASATPSSTMDFPSETTEMIPATMTTIAPSTAEEANMTDKGAASGGNSERGFASDLQSNKRNEAWGAILGTAVAVACVGLVVYVILKKKNQKDFSHRKLVEEFSSDPVLRLDNSEPLDLNYGGSAYYNPALQMDNIQMTNMPGNHKN